MSFGNAAETEILDLLFRNENFANVGDATGLRGATTSGSLYIALHTADVGEAGDQTTNEISYTGYARVGVIRATSGWTLSGDQISNTSAVTFGQRSDVGTSVASHFSAGLVSSGASLALIKGPLGTSLQGAFTGATNDNVTIPGHTLSVDDRVAFFPVLGSSLPTGITEGTLYWVKTSATDVITVSTTQGGATQDITAVGDGIAIKATTLSITQNVTPEFAAGVLVARLD